MSERPDDAVLLALCRQFCAEDTLLGRWNAGEISEVEGAAANDRWWALVCAIERIPARTFEALKAKADCARRALSRVVDDPHDNVVGDLVGHVLRELATWRA